MANVKKIVNYRKQHFCCQINSITKLDLQCSHLGTFREQSVHEQEQKLLGLVTFPMVPQRKLANPGSSRLAVGR